jgi:hypothetical protein
MKKVCSSVPARTTGRALLQSGTVIGVCGPDEVGSKCGIRTTHNGRDAKKFSNVSEKVILISHCETAASERVPNWPVEHHRLRLIEVL